MEGGKFTREEEATIKLGTPDCEHSVNDVMRYTITYYERIDITMLELEL